MPPIVAVVIGGITFFGGVYSLKRTSNWSSWTPQKGNRIAGIGTLCLAAILMFFAVLGELLFWAGLGQLIVSVM